MVQLAAAGDLGSCLLQVLEEGCSARSAADHQVIINANAVAKVFLEPSILVADTAIDLQRRLFRAGLGRAVGVSDLQIAATAISHTSGLRSVTVVHYDAEFEHIARVHPGFRHRWIVPQGSIS